MENVFCSITPKGIFALSLVNTGIIKNLNLSDPVLTKCWNDVAYNLVSGGYFIFEGIEAEPNSNLDIFKDCWTHPIKKYYDTTCLTLRDAFKLFTDLYVNTHMTKNKK